MILSWFNASEAKDFGAALANFYIEKLPPDTPTKKNQEKKQQDVINKMLLQISQFKRNNKLNTYKKAQLGNTFKWTLKNAGYPPTLINALTTQLMLHL